MFYTCGPNEAMVISGVGYKQPNYIVGGRVWVWPCVQRIQKISVTTITLVVESPRVYTKLGVPVSVTGIAQVKIQVQPEMLAKACGMFLGKTEQQTQQVALETLEGHQRAIMGLMTVEEIYQDRKKFAETVFKVAAADLINMGISVVSYTLKDIRDDNNYLHCLGMSRTAEVKRDARVGQATASKDSMIKEAQADEKRLISRYQNDTEIAKSKRDFEIKQHEYNTQVQAQKAAADLAYSLQAAKTKQRIIEEEMEVKVIERAQEISLQEQEIIRKERELDAKVRRPAEAEKYRLEKIAEAQKQQLILSAEAEAEAIRLKGEAQAFAIEAKGKAEAEQMKKKAEAWREFKEAALVEMMLEALPKIAAEIADPLACALTSLKMVSTGSSPIGIAKLTDEIMDIVTRVPSMVEKMTGIQLKKILRGLFASLQQGNLLMTEFQSLGSLNLEGNYLLQACKYFQRESCSFLEGKKTRFQVNDVAQLVAHVTSTSTPHSDKSFDFAQANLLDQSLPIDCGLEDDTLLSKTEFVGGKGRLELAVCQQIVLLAALSFNQKKSARDEMLREETAAYLEVLLADPKNWSVQRAALIGRCKLEIDSKRRFERCLKQLEQLVSETSAAGLISEKNLIENACPKNILFFACNLPSKRNVEKLLGDAMFKFGAVRPALDLYQRLELWPQAIQCYRALNLLDRAETLLRRRLDEDPENFEFWTFLGDVTGCVDHFEKAWLCSGKRYAPAMHNLGVLLCTRKLYAQALDALEKATTIQPILVKAWFTLGHCAVQVGDFSRATRAYHRCVSLDADNFEAWNNLADAYLHLGQKSRAYIILQEALRCEYDNWKLWDNSALISVDLGRFDETLRCLHRLLDLRPKYFDLNLLDRMTAGIVKIFCDATVTDSVDCMELEDQNVKIDSKRLKLDAKKFFGRLTSAIPNEAEIWRMYADIYAADLPELTTQLPPTTNLRPDPHNSNRTISRDTVIPSLESYVTFSRKAFNCARQSPKWSSGRDADARASSARLLRLGVRYAEAELCLTDFKRRTAIEPPATVNASVIKNCDPVQKLESLDEPSKSVNGTVAEFHGTANAVRLTVKPVLSAIRKHYEINDEKMPDDVKCDFDKLCRILDDF